MPEPFWCQLDCACVGCKMTEIYFISLNTLKMHFLCSNCVAIRYRYLIINPADTSIYSQMSIKVKNQPNWNMLKSNLVSIYFFVLGNGTWMKWLNKKDTEIFSLLKTIEPFFPKIWSAHVDHLELHLSHILF